MSGESGLPPAEDFSEEKHEISASEKPPSFASLDFLLWGGSQPENRIENSIDAQKKSCSPKKKTRRSSADAGQHSSFETFAQSLSSLNLPSQSLHPLKNPQHLRSQSASEDSSASSLLLLGNLLQSECATGRHACCDSLTRRSRRKVSRDRQFVDFRDSLDSKDLRNFLENPLSQESAVTLAPLPALSARISASADASSPHCENSPQTAADFKKDLNSTLPLTASLCPNFEKQPGDSAAALSELPPLVRQVLHSLKYIQLRRKIIQGFLPRSSFASLCHDLFVRVFTSSRHGSMYRIYKVLDVVECGEPYEFGGGPTRKRILTEYGTTTNLLFPFSHVSNHSFTEGELMMWYNSVLESKQPLLSMAALERRKEDFLCSFNSYFPRKHPHPHSAPLLLTRQLPTHLESIVNRLPASSSMGVRGKSSGALAKKTAAFSDEIFVSTSTISLVCPITLKKIVEPVKGAECKHQSCFDKFSFLECQKKSQRSKCPICNLNVTDFIPDTHLLRILRKTPPNVKHVHVKPDGTWSSDWCAEECSLFSQKSIPREAENHNSNHHNSADGKSKLPRENQTIHVIQID
eukprot:Sdes_comp19688_c0_seq1m11574